MDFPFIPSPGSVLVDPIIGDNSALKLELKSKGYILKGKVLAVGFDLLTDQGTTIPSAWYAQVGDIIYFLSYEDKFDWIKYKDHEYYIVAFKDIRGRLK